MLELGFNKLSPKYHTWNTGKETRMLVSELCVTEGRCLEAKSRYEDFHTRFHLCYLLSTPKSLFRVVLILQLWCGSRRNSEDTICRTTVRCTAFNKSHRCSDLLRNTKECSLPPPSVLCEGLVNGRSELMLCYRLKAMSPRLANMTR